MNKLLLKNISSKNAFALIFLESVLFKVVYHDFKNLRLLATMF